MYINLLNRYEHASTYVRTRVWSCQKILITSRLKLSDLVARNYRATRHPKISQIREKTFSYKNCARSFALPTIVLANVTILVYHISKRYIDFHIGMCNVDIVQSNISKRWTYLYTVVIWFALLRCFQYR